MKELLTSLEKLKNSGINNLVNSRITEFAEIKNKSSDKIFTELCFCIMTANCSAEKCIEIHENIGYDFLNLSQYQLTNKFKELGYRFPNIRSKYIIEARCNKEELNKRIKSNKNGNMLREWIVSNIKGIGYKEASHFLRNIGYKNYAIIDFHIADLLAKHNLITKPKTMTKKKYLEIEELLKDIGTRLNLNMAELDLFLWYLETSKILK
ncbi:MAG: N-glycosylase/DNA lyase [Promethearchaeota archaeon]|nr:MAG: N-glycosylase/DNA lyase [Candidatus Lokiarchaeota archaeon]